MTFDQMEATLALHGWVWLDYPDAWVGAYKKGWGLVIRRYDGIREVTDGTCVGWSNETFNSGVPECAPGVHPTLRRSIARQIFRKGLL